MSLTRLEKHISSYLYYYTALLSLLASIYFIANRVVINTDGVVYLAASQAFESEGLKAAININPNFFLPVLIAIVSSVFNISELLAADIINSLLISGLAVTFLILIKELGGDSRAQLIGAILILLHPSMSGYKEEIFRDQGYWLCCLLSLIFLLKYQKLQHLKFIYCWFTSLIVATLFRPEASVFILAVFILLFDNPANTRKKVISTALILLILLAAIILAISVLHLLNLEYIYLNTASHLLRYLNSGSINIDLGAFTEQFKGLFSREYPQDFVWLGIILILLPILLASFIGALSWPYCLIWLYVRFKKTGVIPQSKAYRFYMLLNAFVLVAFLSITFFVTPRYLTLFSLFILAPLAIALSTILKTISWDRKKIATWSFVVFVLFVDSFISFGYSVSYLTDGIDWVHQNTPQGSRVISNQRNITYSIDREKEFFDSERVFSSWEANELKNIILQYDYFVEDTFWNKEELMPVYYPEAAELARFASERGNRIVIYDLKPLK